MRIKDRVTGEPVFKTFQVELVCQKCKEAGKGHDCQHMLHLVPRWQSSQKHERMKLVMQDRPDLIQSELAGLAFDSLQQAFRPADIEVMMITEAMKAQITEPIFIFIDPAAGGPSSDYCILSLTRNRGMITVSLTPPQRRAQELRYSAVACRTKSETSKSSFWIHMGIRSSCRSTKNRRALPGSMGSIMDKVAQFDVNRAVLSMPPSAAFWFLGLLGSTMSSFTRMSTFISRIQVALVTSGPTPLPCTLLDTESRWLVPVMSFKRRTMASTMSSIRGMCAPYSKLKKTSC